MSKKDAREQYNIILNSIDLFLDLLPNNILDILEESKDCRESFCNSELRDKVQQMYILAKEIQQMK